MDTAHMVTRSVWLPAMSKKSIIRTTLQNVWRLVPLWVQLRDVPLSVKTPIREISSSFWEDVPAVTVSVVQQVPPRYTQRLPSKSAVQKYRKVTHLQSVRSSVCSDVKKSATSSKNVTTLVQAVYPLPSVSLQMDFA